MMTDRLWRIGPEYRDRGGKSFVDDEILRWLDTGVAGSIQNSSGIRYKDCVSNCVKDPETGRVVPAFFVLTTTEMSAQHHNPWHDVVDQCSGTIHYWGDAKFSARNRFYNGFPGNARLEATNNIRLARQMSEMPPILHFSRKRSGYLTFNGLCVLSDLRQAWFEDKGQPVKNLRALLSILDTETVSAEWLRQRVMGGDIRKVDLEHAPPVWLKAKKGKIDRRHVWAAKIRSTEQQMPTADSEDGLLLEQVRNLSPTEFEAFIVALVDKLPDIVSGLEHTVTRTRLTGDHGVDFFGMFRLPSPIAYEIEFVGEAKRYSSAITPDQVSRLVARLGRGQYGLYFTTSWYSKQTQREIQADRYPVRLFAGQDIIDILRAGDCVSGGKIRTEWLKMAIDDSPAHVSDGPHPLAVW
jgi:hypothetical protein